MYFWINNCNKIKKLDLVYIYTIIIFLLYLDLPRPGVMKAGEVVAGRLVNNSVFFIFFIGALGYRVFKFR